MTDSFEVIDSDVRKEERYKEYAFPITFSFKMGTLANDFTAKDANGKTIAYVRQKMFRLKEAIQIFTNENRSDVLYTIEADRIIDFNACYRFADSNNRLIGKIGRRGMRSLWKASYEIFHTGETCKYTIREENPWAKVGDFLLCEIPILGIFSGYVFNPKYAVFDNEGAGIVRVSKIPGMFSRQFKVEKIGDLPEGDDECVMLSLMMMILLERRRG